MRHCDVISSQYGLDTAFHLKGDTPPPSGTLPIRRPALDPVAVVRRPEKTEPKRHAPTGITFLLIVSIILALGQVARAETADELLRKAERYYEQLEYETALRTLIQLLQQPKLKPVQRARAYLYMGVCFTALGRAENAVQAFMEVLKIRPKFRLPAGVSPSIRAMFAEALKRSGKPGAATSSPGSGQPSQPNTGKPPAQPTATQPPDEGVLMLARAPKHTSAGSPVSVTIRVDDPKDETRSVILHWRRQNGPDFSKVKLRYRAGRAKYKATIPGAVIGNSTGTLTYYVEARDSKGNVLATEGTEDDPRRIKLSEGHGDHGSSSGGSNWGWWTLGIGGGVAAIAGGVVAAILLTQDDSPSTTADVVITVK